MAANYECRFCHTMQDATAEDLEDARRYEAQAMNDDPELVKSFSDQELMDRFGREICPTCTGESHDDDEDDVRWPDTGRSYSDIVRDGMDE